MKNDKKLFNTFSGVFVPATEAILGAVLFLLLPGLVAEMGLLRSILIILLSHTVTLSTAVSLSNCVTNLNVVGGGGMYAISRRSLGKAFSASIGIQLYIAQSVSIAFYSIGFIEPLQPILEKIIIYKQIFGHFDILTQKQIISSVLLFIFFIIALFGADFIVKLQMIILVILGVSVICVFTSLFFPSLFLINGENVFTGLINLNGLDISKLTFWSAFLIFFPAVTGIDAGVGMSGDLKNPQRSIVRGTFIAISLTMLIYLAITVVYSLISPKLLLQSDGTYRSAVDLLNVMPFSIFVLLGVLFATSSSGLSYFMTAPRTAFALTHDNILPNYLRFLGNDFKKGGKEPRFAATLTFFIALGIIWIGNLAFVSMIVGICFLVVYGWINFSAFLEKISKNPSFRPTFKGNAFISLYGYFICIVLISLYDVFIGLGVLAIQIIIFLLVLKYKTQNKLEGVWWGVFFSIVNYLLKKLKIIVQGTKNWRPIVIIFKRYDKNLPYDQVVELGEMIAQNQGMVALNLINIDNHSKNNNQSLESSLQDYKYNIPAHVIEMPKEEFRDVVLSIVQSSNVSGLQANSVLLKYSDQIKIDWADLIDNILSYNKNILLLKAGITTENAQYIDLYWFGRENGNLMALLAIVIFNAYKSNTSYHHLELRVIRKLAHSEDFEQSTLEMNELINRIRLPGKILIIPPDEKSFTDTVLELSNNAKLIIMGLPGTLKKEGIVSIFKPSRQMFEEQIKIFHNMPPVLYVKAASILNLVDND